MRWLPLLLLPLWLFGRPVEAVEVPAEFEAVYRLERNGLSLGETRISHHRDGDAWLYASRSRASGLISLLVDDVIEEQSRWVLHRERVRPLEYRYHRHGGDKERLVQLEFDWERGRVVNRVDGDPWVMEVPEAALDKLVYQMAIALDLAAGRHEMVYEIADGGRLKSYHLEVAGEERIVSPLGEFDTLVVQRTKESDDKTTRLWCAPAAAYLPVKIEQTKEDGEALTMVIQSLER